MLYIKYILPILLSLLLAACSGDPGLDSRNGTKQSAGDELTPFELEHGIGPITEELDLGEIDRVKAQRGKDIFDSKCAACHMPDTRMVGPAYGDVLERRSPEFVVNIILNPGEMIRKHPEGKKMLAEYMTPMPFQNVSKEDALAILEYFRTLE